AKKLVAAGARVRIERGAGFASGFVDEAYVQAGAEPVADAAAALDGADLVLCVQPPAAARLQQLREGTVLIGLLAPQADPERAAAITGRGLVAFALERLPRTTRAQSMD